MSTAIYRTEGPALKTVELGALLHRFSWTY